MGSGFRGAGAGARRPQAGGASREAGEDSEGTGNVLADRRYVVLGPSDGIRTQIVSGVSEGDDILIPVPEWLIRFRTEGPGEVDERTRRRARMML